MNDAERCGWINRALLPVDDIRRDPGLFENRINRKYERRFS